MCILPKNFSIPDLKAHPLGKYVVLAFESDIGHTLSAACELDHDNDAVVLAKAARIIRQDLFDLRSSTNKFNGSFDDNCQSLSVPVSLLGFVCMVHEGPNIKDLGPVVQSVVSLTSSLRVIS